MSIQAIELYLAKAKDLVILKFPDYLMWSPLQRATIVVEIAKMLQVEANAK